MRRPAQKHRCWWWPTAVACVFVCPFLLGATPRPLVVVTDKRIDIKEKVRFHTGSATIDERSFPLLDQVAAAIRAHPEFKKLRVEGHTDDSGDDDANLRLSQARADTVRNHLVSLWKIEASRLVAVGYGEHKPLTSNATEKGREMNRRVMFIVIEDANGPTEESEDDAPPPSLRPIPKAASDEPDLVPVGSTKTKQ
jgi:outer membrane protein OmpA-like peptidoglycan-associated protein